MLTADLKGRLVSWSCRQDVCHVSRATPKFTSHSKVTTYSQGRGSFAAQVSQRQAVALERVALGLEVRQPHSSGKKDIAKWGLKRDE